MQENLGAPNGVDRRTLFLIGTAVLAGAVSDRMQVKTPSLDEIRRAKQEANKKTEELVQAYESGAQTGMVAATWAARLGVQLKDGINPIANYFSGAVILDTKDGPAVIYNPLVFPTKDEDIRWVAYNGSYLGQPWLEIARLKEGMPVGISDDYEPDNPYPQVRLRLGALDSTEHKGGPIDMSILTGTAEKPIVLGDFQYL